jgi:hypothetical protein
MTTALARRTFPEDLPSPPRSGEPSVPTGQTLRAAQTSAIRPRGVGAGRISDVGRTVPELVGVPGTGVNGFGVNRFVANVGAGTAGRSGTWLKGHYAAGRWRHRESAEVAHEVFVSGELLGHEARDVMATLLHEATHAVAHERKIQDMSRGGRYHNARFRALAIELGLRVEQAGPLGWSATSMPDETVARYRRELTALGKALTASRDPELGGGRGRTNNNDGRSRASPCGRRIRASRLVVA